MNEHYRIKDARIRCFLGVSLISLILKIELKNNGNIFLKYNGINAFVRSPEHGHIPIDKKHTDML